ncbi:hypothetical protein PVAND_006638 [Polypedilum vanderplanki]|uniref:START domain-containing protein 10 n=1 Tax=Polypedilum vanderplanki TaxID=319348 RepID=A0A9J6C4A4_POLVA|nr:hypothetical protein PVAND_006638 [Polypedilum vanderplanki]
MARIAEDNDFDNLKQLVDDNDGWILELDKSETKVYTRPVEGCSFQMVKITTFFEDISAEILYDVLHDPDYRKVWDTHMLESLEIGVFNVNNDIGYYAMQCPAPLRPRDFVLQRSWLDTGCEQMLISRSVEHKDYPPKKGYVRAFTHITGFLLRSKPPSGCILNYVAQCDPQGKLPPWLVNKVTHTLGPRMIKDLRKAALGYVQWKYSQSHFRKPWRYPEDITVPRILIEDCWEPAKIQQGQLDIAEASKINIAQSNSLKEIETTTKNTKVHSNGDKNVNFNTKSNSTNNSPVLEKKKTSKRKFKFKFDKFTRDRSE